jgi:hypothetical protein
MLLGSLLLGAAGPMGLLSKGSSMVFLLLTWCPMLV